MQDGSPAPTSDGPQIETAETVEMVDTDEADGTAGAAADGSATDPIRSAAAGAPQATAPRDPTPSAGQEDAAEPAGDEPYVDERPLPHAAGISLRVVLAWARIAHAPYLVLSVAPVVVVAALLWAQDVAISLGLLILTACAAALIQAGAHTLDAYLDYVRAQRLIATAPNESVAQHASLHIARLLQAGIYPLDALRAAAVLLVLGACLGIPLALAGGVPVLLLGAGGVLVAFLYSATSYALKRLPLGELAVALALGPGMVAVTALAQGQPITPFILALGAGLGLFAGALVMAANLRALTPEMRDGRRTLVRLVGRARGRRLYLATLVAAYAVVVVAALWQGAPHGALAVLFSLPVAILPLTGALRARVAATLTPVVRGTLRAYAYFAFWLTIGLLLGGLYLHLLRLAGA